MYKFILSYILVPVLFIALVTPAQAATQAQYYQANSQQQQISYLYALIAQLQLQLAALQTYNPSYPNYNNAGNTSSNEISRVVTGRVDAAVNDSVRMEGEVTFRRDTDARVWFEYGVNTNLSYSTKSIEIRGDEGDTEDFEITATDFDNRVYYYRAVAEDDNGRYVEGVVKSFRFDGRNNYDDDWDDWDDIDNDWSLDVDNDYYETGDTVSVDYTVEDEDDRNWVGLYEIGARDSNYVAFKYVRDDEGSVSFRINNEGEYEFRLFDSDGDQVAESDEFEVED